MNHGSLFSGIGGFDLASTWMNWENKFHCELDPFCRKVLNYHYPESETYEDIKQADFTIWRNRIDILTGGFPCQPFSMAGKRKGTEDDRHLWPEMLRAIREIKPRWIVGENVRGLLSWNEGMVFEQVCVDLENEGYEVQAFIIPACGKDAPHRRERVWIIAFNSKRNDDGGHYTRTSKGKGVDLERDKLVQTRRKQGPNDNKPSGTNDEIITNTKNRDDGRNIGEPEERQELESGNGIVKDPSSNTPSNRRTRKGQRIATEARTKRYVETWEPPRGFKGLRLLVDVANTSSQGLQRSEINGGIRKGRENRNKQFTGCIPPNWEKFPTQSPLCTGDDGFSSRLLDITFSKLRRESIKAAGNAIVPQVAFEIFTAIQEYENNYRE